MKKSFFSAYLPSLIAMAAVAALALLLDHQTRTIKSQDLRADVNAQLEILRTRLESQVESGILITRGLASIISREDLVTQKEFSAYARAVTDDRPEVINIAWAPDLVITRVYPVEGNERAIGLDYRTVSDQLQPVLAARDTGQIAFVGPIDLVQGGKGFIVRVPVYSTTGDNIEFLGILSTVFDLEAFLVRAGFMTEALSIETAIAAIDTVGKETAVFHGDPAVITDRPVISEVHFPGGNWRMFARPQTGWDSVNDTNLRDRALLALLALFIMVPLVTANRLALSRQRTIRDMQLADHRLKAFVRNFPGAFFTYLVSEGKRDRVDFITDACRDIWGVEPAEIYQSPAVIWKSMGAEDIDNLRTEIAQARETMRSWNYAWKSTTPDGDTKWLEGWGHPHQVSDDVLRWDCFVVDVTEQRRHKEEFARQAEIARQAQKQESIGQLTGGVAHDFNNMLAVIRGNMEMLHEDLVAEGVENDGRLEFVESAITASERGSDLTKKMLSFARRARLVPEDVDLNEVVKELEAWTSRTLPATIEIRNSLAPELPLIHVDRSSTASALLNLIVNARDAMPAGGQLSIKTRQTQLSARDVAKMPESVVPGDYVVLSITDTGEGIDADKLDAIFEPFYTTKAPGAGSGLGLSMVQGFIAQSGGAVRIQSTPGQGTTVELYFRAVTQPTTVAPQPPEPSQGHTENRLHLLVAEDEQEVRQVLVRTLERLGHSVDSAPNGDLALELFRTKPRFDLVITDVVMPGRLQGYDLAAEIRRLEPNFPVIFLSGYNAPPMAEKAGLHANEVRLTKPVTRKDLVAAMEKVLGRSFADAP